MAKNKSSTVLAPEPKAHSAKPTTKSDLSSPIPKRTWVLSLSLFAVVVAVFWSATRNDFLYWYGDDPGYVTENLHVQKGVTVDGIKWAFRNIDLGNWHPLTFLSHMLDCQIYGLKPWGHHLTSVLFHAANVVLLFLALRKMTGATWRCLAVALLFGLHPLRVESVAWVAERKDVLAAFFWMLTLLAYAHYAEESKVRGSKSKIFYGLALAAFACGLMSKGIVVTLPFALLLLDYWPLKRLEQTTVWKLVLEKVSFFCLAIATSVITFVAQKNWGFVQTVEKYSLAARLENALVSYGRYLGKMFWPVNLEGYYPHPGRWPMSIVLGVGVVIIGISVLAIVTRRKWTWLSVGWFWYLGTLVPVIGIVQLADIAMAERYTYIPMIGILVALVWGVHELTKEWRYQREIASAVCVVTLLFCTMISQRQISYFKDSVVLWRHVFEMTGNVEVAQFALGLSLDKQGHTKEGIKELQAALQSVPERADIHFNLAIMFDKTGEVDEAIKHYSETVRISPDYKDGRLGLGQNLVRKGKFEEAVVQFEKAIESTNDLRVHIPLAQALASVGRFDEAIEKMQAVLKATPHRYDVHLDLANLLDHQKRTAEAIQHYSEAIRLNPKSSTAQSRLGLILYEDGRIDECLSYLREAAKLNRENKTYAANVNHTLGAALASKGLIDELISCLNESLKHESATASLHANLGFALTAKGLTNEAIYHLEEAIKLDPKSNDVAAFLDSVRRTGKAPPE